MALALLLGTALATAGFLLVSVQGFLVPSDLAGASAAAKTVVTRHIAWAIPTVIFSLFSQSMVIFFFIGTGRLVKDDVASLPEEERLTVLAALRRLKKETSPPATFALLSAIAVFVLGGAAHTKALPAFVHLLSAVAAVVIHLWALFAEWRAFGENARLMSDPRSYARSHVGAAALQSPPGGSEAV